MASRIDLPLPPPWTSRAEGDLVVWTLPGTDLRVEVDSPAQLPDDRKAWGERVLFRNLPDGGTIEQLDIVDSVGKTGYPCTVVSTRVLDRERKPLEFRVTFFFEFLYVGGVVCCRVHKADIKRWEEEQRAIVVEAIRGARPIVQDGEVGYLGELYDLEAIAKLPRRGLPS